jgi:hypothetical protein
MSAPRLDLPKSDLYHGDGAVHWDDECQERLYAACARCHLVVVCCTLGAAEIDRMLNQTWRCPGCRETVAVDPPVSLSPADEDGAAAAAGIAFLAALFVLLMFALAGFLYLMHLAGTGVWPW